MAIEVITHGLSAVVPAPPSAGQPAALAAEELETGATALELTAALELLGALELSGTEEDAPMTKILELIGVEEDCGIIEMELETGITGTDELDDGSTNIELDETTIVELTPALEERSITEMLEDDPGSDALEEPAVAEDNSPASLELLMKTADETTIPISL